MDDFEDADLATRPSDNRQGLWFPYDDMTGGSISLAVEPVEGGHALHVTGGGYSSWGALFASYLTYDIEAGTTCFYDASAYGGVRFRIRGTGRVRFTFDARATLEVEYGGDCDDGSDCFDRHGATLELSEEWQTFTFDFCDLVQEGWGTDRGPLDSTQLAAFNFHMQDPESFEVWLDDVAFVPADEGTSGACGPACPSDQLPRGITPAPETSSLDLESAGLELHTFEQPTPSCGPVTRRYLVHVPASLPDDTAAPVLIVLHGTGADAESMQAFMTQGRFDALADRDGFVVVYANAAASASTQAEQPNGGSWRDHPTNEPQVDDLAYLDLVVQDLVERSVISGENPLYLAGLSNGGAMAWSAALRAPERFAGVAAVMPGFGWMPEPPPSPSPSLRFLLAYAVDDPGVPPGFHESLQPMPEAWAAALGIDDAPTEQALPDLVVEGDDPPLDDPTALATRDSRATRIDHGPNPQGGAVRTIVFDRAGHFWPVPEPNDPPAVIADFGYRNRDVDMAEQVWSFFSPEAP